MAIIYSLRVQPKCLKCSSHNELQLDYRKSTVIIERQSPGPNTETAKTTAYLVSFLGVVWNYFESEGYRTVMDEKNKCLEKFQLNLIKTRILSNTIMVKTLIFLMSVWTILICSFCFMITRSLFNESKLVTVKTGKHSMYSTYHCNGNVHL